MENFCKIIVKKYKPKVVPMLTGGGWAEKSCWVGIYKSDIYVDSYGSKLLFLKRNSGIDDAERALNKYLISRYKVAINGKLLQEDI